MKALYVAWEDPIDHKWFPVGCLTAPDNSFYRFVYTKGAKMSNHFTPFGRLDDLESAYESSELFPFFVNRLLPESRPEFNAYLRWINLSKDKYHPFMMLATTGGLRSTDTLEVFPCPERTDENRYEVHFFSHGLRYLDKHVIERVNGLKPQDKLCLLPDVQNEWDPYAIALRPGEDPAEIIGYCPRYFCEDFNELSKTCGPKNINVTVERVNLDAPLQMRLLCKLSACWPDDFKPCRGEKYDPIPEGVVSCALK